jgi:hypothetical protein
MFCGWPSSCAGAAGALSQCSIPPLCGQRDLWPDWLKNAGTNGPRHRNTLELQMCNPGASDTQPKPGPRCAVKGVAISGHEHLDAASENVAALAAS